MGMGGGCIIFYFFSSRVHLMSARLQAKQSTGKCSSALFRPESTCNVLRFSALSIALGFLWRWGEMWGRRGWGKVVSIRERKQNKQKKI